MNHLLNLKCQDHMSQTTSRRTFLRSQLLGRGNELSDQDFERYMFNSPRLGKRKLKEIELILSKPPWLEMALQVADEMTPRPPGLPIKEGFEEETVRLWKQIPK